MAKPLDGLKTCMVYEKKVGNTTKRIEVKGAGSLTEAGKAIDRVNH